MAHASSREGMPWAAAESAGAMEAALDYGVVAGGSIQMLEQVVHEVYVPLAARHWRALWGAALAAELLVSVSD